LSGDAVPLLFVAACWLLMILLADPRGDFPLNDDWVYALAVKSVLETGSYQFPSPSSANVGPQIYWGALFCLPFGFSFTTLRLSTSVLGLGGAVVFYFLVRAVRGTRRTAVLCALALAANPVYFSLSNTFMTDVPFLAVSLVAMLLLFLGLRRDSLAHVTSGMLVALAAILIRQLGIVLIVGYVVAALVKEGWQVRRVARGVALVALGLAVHFGYQLWLVRTGRVPVATLHSDAHTLIPTLQLVPKIKALVAALLYTGFFVAPFVALLWFRPRTAAVVSRSTLLIYVASALLLFFALRFVDALLPAAGNVLIRSGLGPLLLVDAYVLALNQPAIPFLARAGWALVSLLAIASILTAGRQLARPVAQLANSVLRRRAAPQYWELAFFAAIVLSYLSILILLSGKVPIFDRYYLPFLPLVVLMICSAMPEPVTNPLLAGRLAPVVLVFLLAAFSVIATHDFFAWSRARWTALRDLIAEGVPPQKIDGGYEFNGWYLSHLQPPNDSWSWSVVDDEYVIASGGLPNYTELRRYSFRHWLFGRPSYVLTLRKINSQSR